MNDFFAVMKGKDNICISSIDRKQHYFSRF